MRKKIVLTGGKFNRIHKGHVWLLSKAKRMGYLIVVLAHDVRNKRAYAVSARTRKKNLEKLGIADKVVVGHKEKFSSVIRRYNPSVIVLGYDQKLPAGTDKLVKQRRIKVVKLGKHGSYATRKMDST